MAKRGIVAGAALGVLVWATGLLPADEPAGAPPVTRVVKFAGTKGGMSGGRPTMLLSVTSKYGGSPMDFVIPNNDANARKADPIAAVTDALKGVQKGDLIKVRYAKNAAGRFVLEQVEKFKARPGEEDPEAYEFVALTDANVGGQAYRAVVLRKADKEQTSLVPNKKNDQGATAPDDAVLAQIGALSPGDLADAEVSPAGSPTYLKGIYPYRAPKPATFVKSGTVKDANRTLYTVELKADAQSAVVYLRPTGPNNAPDPVLLAKVRSLQANSAVLYKAVEDGGKTWLIAIRANVQPGEVTLNGTYTWNGKPRETVALKADLKPTGNGEWRAVYTFMSGTTKKTWTGTVKGDLKNGEVSGTGGGDGRTFVFTGTSRDGVITFNHFETTGGRRVATGPGMLR